MSERIFVDTSAYYALVDNGENTHAQAQRCFQRLTLEQATLYTTNIVAFETHTLILNRMNRKLAEQMLDRLYASSTQIIRSTERDEQRAREIIRQYQDKAFSMVDAISFAVMQRLHLRNVWTYDQHFAQFGFALVQE